MQLLYKGNRSLSWNTVSKNSLKNKCAISYFHAYLSQEVAHSAYSSYKLQIVKKISLEFVRVEKCGISCALARGTILHTILLPYWAELPAQGSRCCAPLLFSTAAELESQCIAIYPGTSDPSKGELHSPLSSACKHQQPQVLLPLTHPLLRYRLLPPFAYVFASSVERGSLSVLARCLGWCCLC